jgi:hypothetical protein
LGHRGPGTQGGKIFFLDNPIPIFLKDSFFFVAGTQIGEIFFFPSNFLLLPELLCVLTNLIANAVSTPSLGSKAAQCWQVEAMTTPSSSGTQTPATACRR